MSNQSILPVASVDKKASIKSKAKRAAWFCAHILFMNNGRKHRRLPSLSPGLLPSRRVSRRRPHPSKKPICRVAHRQQLYRGIGMHRNRGVCQPHMVGIYHQVRVIAGYDATGNGMAYKSLRPVLTYRFRAGESLFARISSSCNEAMKIIYN